MKKFLYIIILFFVVNAGFAQTNTIKGRIVAFKGFALNNVTVVAKKSKATATTDSSGNFQIVCKEKDVLKIKASGFYPLTAKVSGRASYKINLIYMNTPKTYKEVVENKHLTKKTLDHCIANFLDENNNFDKMNSIFQIIQSVHSSAQISSIDGVKKVILQSRGPNSLESGHEALLVVDGIVTNDISGVHPEQVKSVNVLIGNEAGHWGSRGGNGVVEITLKSGL